MEKNIWKIWKKTLRYFNNHNNCIIL